MSATAVQEIRLRTILDSRGERTVEAELALAGGATGTGSCPRAIAAGHRERPRSPVAMLGSGGAGEAADRIRTVLQGATIGSQAELDALLPGLAGAAANVTLAVSVAFCRATATDAGLPLHQHLARLAGTTPSVPHLLVNVFSGGVHVARPARSPQQLMLAPDLPTVAEEIELALALFAATERRLAGDGRPVALSASSGIVRRDAEPEALLAELRDDAAALPGAAGALQFGVDVAAEHLAGPDAYRLGIGELSGEALLDRLERLALEYRVSYLEDPFAPRDEALWRELRTRLSGTTCVVGDDLFATDPDRVDPALADGILLKPSQAGTVTETLGAARRARDAGMTLCVSHRSGETEDTFICDLAVALGARWIKAGGPRRGDRISKLNQLLRLSESRTPHPPTEEA
jgi:enolase